MTKGKRDGQTMIYYQVNHDRNHWNIILTERYILHMLVLLECYYIYTCKWKVHNGKIDFSLVHRACYTLLILNVLEYT
jgi:hypothetical protein